MKLKDLGCDEQPREKMLSKGANALSNAELLAILLRTGAGELNVVEVCRDLLRQAGDSLSQLSDWSADRLQEIGGIGPAKALTIGASFELARRWFSEKSRLSETCICDAHSAYRIFHPQMRSLSHEECWVMFLTRSNSVAALEKMTSGSLSATAVDVRTIVRRAIEKHATGIIIAHNHPSGNPRPGTADISYTDKLRDALAAFEIALLDHIVVCDDCFFSFADDGVCHPD